MATVTAMPLEVNETLWRMPVERYHAMIRSGVLSDDDRIELLEGVLVEKMSKNPAHRIATRKTGDALRAVLPAGWYVDEQAPVTTADSEPEPDISLMRGSTGDYADRHPGPADVALAVEVADLPSAETAASKNASMRARRLLLTGCSILTPGRWKSIPSPGMTTMQVSRS